MTQRIAGNCNDPYYHPPHISEADRERSRHDDQARIALRKRMVEQGKLSPAPLGPIGDTEYFDPWR